MASLALAREFLARFSKLDQALQKRVVDLAEKCRQLSLAELSQLKGTQLETYRLQKDPRARTIRLGDKDRGIALVSEGTEQIVLVDVLPHQAAERWMANNEFKVNAAQIRLHYREILDRAFALLPPGPPPRRRHRGGWSICEREAWNLASRLRDDADDVLRLLDDTAVPLTNNAAERSLRMVKLHDKISGTFRSEEGASAFATIRSYLQTAAQNGQNRLEVLRRLFTSGPWLPAVCRT